MNEQLTWTLFLFVILFDYFFLTWTEMPRHWIQIKKLRSRARTSAVSFPWGWYDFWCVSLCGWSLLTGAGEWWGHILSRSSRKIAKKIITNWAPSNIMVTMNTDSREIKRNIWNNWEFLRDCLIPFKFTSVSNVFFVHLLIQKFVQDWKSAFSQALIYFHAIFN